jgi:acetyl esterase/lipase
MAAPVLSTSNQILAAKSDAEASLPNSTHLSNNISRNGHSNYKVIRDLLYREETNQKLDLYLPSAYQPSSSSESSEISRTSSSSNVEISFTTETKESDNIQLQLQHNRPLVIFIHGGAWVDRDKEQYSFVGRAFAQMGIAAAVVDYTLSPHSLSDIIHPIHTLDCAAAVHWLREHARDYGYKADEIFLFGHSAGGFMSGLLALDKTYLGRFGESPTKALRGCIGLQGIYDLIQLDKDFPEYRKHFIDFAFGLNKENWAAASPQNHPLSDQDYAKAAWLVLHAPMDSLVNTLQATRFVSHLQKLGIPTQFIGDGLSGDHFEELHKIGNEGSALLGMVRDFVNRVLAQHVATS